MLFANDPRGVLCSVSVSNPPPSLNSLKTLFAADLDGSKFQNAENKNIREATLLSGALGFSFMVCNIKYQTNFIKSNASPSYLASDCMVNG